MGKEKEIYGPSDGPSRHHVLPKGSSIKMSSAQAVPALQHNDLFGETEKKIKETKIYFATTPPPPWKRNTNQQTSSE